ncbi:hypothetical protein EDM56_22575 [Brevibacillus fluminis]|uniref:YaaC family protein n=1 Tax=Brevibacillus fluminis TaxID=511487 RepID=A0A3M8D3P7_9BACL|nr:hypothetical protein EDM56_22575 [Brevibacillus fluminis]
MVRNLAFSSWDFLRFLETEPTARRLLAAFYQKHGFESPDKLAFQQSTRLLYTVKHARQCYETAATSDLLIKPLLLFYGCTHLLKAVILCKDPTYPQNSRMLQHGVTTRKVKRTPYHILDDEVRPQKEGLFAHAAKLLRIPNLQERYTMGELFSVLPELTPTYTELMGPNHWDKVTYHEADRLLSFPQGTRGSLLYSRETFLDYLTRHGGGNVAFSLHGDGIPIGSPVGTQAHVQVMPKSNVGLEAHPLFASTPQGYYFWNVEGNDVPPPQWAVHFLLLYLLGMLCRYEAELWGDFVYSHSYGELVLVEHFFSEHLERFPLLISELIQKEPVKKPRPPS